MRTKLGTLALILFTIFAMNAFACDQTANSTSGRQGNLGTYSMIASSIMAPITIASPSTSGTAGATH
jgi:hypothetical protein